MEVEPLRAPNGLVDQGATVKHYKDQINELHEKLEAQHPQLNLPDPIINSDVISMRGGNLLNLEISLSGINNSSAFEAAETYRQTAKSELVPDKLKNVLDNLSYASAALGRADRSLPLLLVNTIPSYASSNAESDLINAQHSLKKAIEAFNALEEARPENSAVGKAG